MMLSNLSITSEKTTDGKGLSSKTASLSHWGSWETWLIYSSLRQFGFLHFTGGARGRVSLLSLSLRLPACSWLSRSVCAHSRGRCQDTVGSDRLLETSDTGGSIQNKAASKCQYYERTRILVKTGLKPIHNGFTLWEVAKNLCTCCEAKQD